ncbi:MAG TPA: hypothetical protein GXX57_11160 [Firmicutes bacterium]|nr:hypothetical protein [Bacillota bacterium]
MKRLGFGIVGCGVAVQWHQAALARVPDARLVCVCDQVNRWYFRKDLAKDE